MTFNQGDIITIDFNPQSGHDILNHHSSLLLVCPITNTNKNHPFHITLDKRTKTTGVILCDQAKMLDIAARNAEFKEKCPSDIWEEAKELIISFM